MAEFRLERFKYNWRGTWATGTAYKRDDVVRVNGKSYVCIVTHVSSSLFRADLLAILPGSVPPQPQPKWTVMTSGRSFEGDWTTGTAYSIGDIVLYNGSLWLCAVPHESTTFSADADNWEIFARTNSFVGEWQPGTSYASGAIVTYNGNAYKCITTHLSEGALVLQLDDSAVLWEIYFEGVEYRGMYQSGQQYRLNDLVKYGGAVYRCIETHFASTVLDRTKFTIEAFGSQFEEEWNNSTNYNIGDIVQHRGFTYYAINNNINSKPFIDTDTPSLNWILISRNYNFIGNWSLNDDYKTGDIVLRGGYLYLALRDIASTEIVDGSTLDYLDDNTWEILVPSKSWKSNWTSGTNYELGDVIYWKGSAYSCNFAHESSIENFPGDNGNGFEYWDLLLQAGREGGLRERGDILTYGKSREISYLDSTVFDDSVLGDVRLPIGEEQQILSVTRDLEVYWRDIVEDADTVYVATNGLDEEGRGTYQNPFKTIRYACEYVEDNFDPLTPVIVRVSAGKFEEIAPIIVPAGCAVNGDELRTTTILANPPLPEYQGDFTYHNAAIQYLKTFLFNIITGLTVTPLQGNEAVQVNRTNFELLNYQDPITGNLAFPASSIDAVNRVGFLLDNYIEFIRFRVESGSINPTLTGSNTETDNTNFLNASTILRANSEFIVQQLASYLIEEYPNRNFSRTRLVSDFREIIRGSVFDCLYANSNYYTLLAARRYANATTGSQLENLFLMRDSTGLRDCTTGGLRGTLNPPGVFDLYQKPTGGALVSLDPGWGPDDERCWIINRSPYIQGVTNTGTGCIGKKVDGALHNGGTKSMVSNDFTQVLSDGIGVWVTNNGRTELVSVFTYYCQIGYFAEDGGVIRAANGNNSYGRYGAISDGVDATEVPQTAKVFNRTSQALVEEAFAGGNNDSVLIFEYSNAGSAYTEADATITGSGANADVEYTDFRDGALFEVRLTSPDGSSNEGGSGYLVRQGSAQETLGASSTIILSQNDVTQQLSEIEGMRIIITDGTGVGQYGYVDGFNFITKTVTVRRERDDELGWDHIIPGTPIATNLDLTTRYRIEPRIVVSSPGFATQPYDSFTNRTFVDAAFGGFTQTFTGVSGGSSLIWKDENLTFITLNEIVSSVALKVNAVFSSNPTVPFRIKGRTSGITLEVTAVTANTGEILELDASGNVLGLQSNEEFDLILTSGSGETFDGSPDPATFNVVRSGKTYTPTLVTGGAGYEAGDIITILGTALGGTSPENDLKITVLTASDDSSNSILTFSSSGTGRPGRFVSLTNNLYSRYSDDGVSWVERELSFSGDYRKLISGNNRFLALANNESRLSSSLNGVNWSTVNLPLTASWTDGTWGNGKFVLVADDTDVVAVSSDGATWTTAEIPGDTVGDSTTSQWIKVVYGKGRYVAISGNDRATATSTNGTTWTRHDLALPDLSPGNDWNVVSLAYGNNKFVIFDSTGRNAYSFDGVTWYLGSPAQALYQWNDMKYSQGVFFAIGHAIGNPANGCVTSEDGINWTDRTLDSEKLWTALTHGTLNGTSTWVVLSSAATTDSINHVFTGATAKARANVTVGIFNNIKIWESGSGYTTPPTVTIVDPNAVVEVAYEARIGVGVLSQPDFINRGAGYRKASSVITITGDGYADIVPKDTTIVLSGVRFVPGPGVQLQISGILDLETELIANDLKIFNGVEIFDLGDDGTGNETRLVRLTVTPSIGVENNVAHNTTVTLREKFSQCRISGHDFLDVGTGNFENTNYPQIYAGGAYFVASPENEVYETNSGRVFYVSTDQDGNFRTGELFSVQQATGVVTISAQFFDLDGLSQLALGGVRLGGSGAVVQEFSNDPTFSADSNNVVPTQRAIATFLANRLSVGGENLEVNKIVAGRVSLGGENSEIEVTTNQYLQIPINVTFDGTYEANDGAGNITTEKTAIQGTIISQMFLVKSSDDTMQ